MTETLAPGPATAASDALQPQDLVITLLGMYVRPPGDRVRPSGDRVRPSGGRVRPPGDRLSPSGDRVWSGGLVALLGELGFSQGAARVALTRLVRRGLIARERSGRLVHYRVTPRCSALLAEGDGRIFSLGSPPPEGDGWTVLWHQIPEDRRLERSRLARRLRFLGFGSVQDSVWISPHDHSLDVERLLDELDVAEFATVFLARVGTASGLPALVSRAWDLTGLVERYEAFVTSFKPYRSARARAGLGDREAFLVRTRLVHMFRGFPLVDPELPEDLAPLSRSRGEAVALFHDLYEGLAAASQRHFDAVTRAFSEP